MQDLRDKEMFVWSVLLEPLDATQTGEKYASPVAMELPVITELEAFLAVCFKQK